TSRDAAASGGARALLRARRRSLRRRRGGGRGHPGGARVNGGVARPLPSRRTVQGFYLVEIRFAQWATHIHIAFLMTTRPLGEAWEQVLWENASIQYKGSAPSSCWLPPSRWLHPAPRRGCSTW